MRGLSVSEQKEGCEREGPMVDSTSWSPDVSDADSDHAVQEAVAVVASIYFEALERTPVVKSLLD